MTHSDELLENGNLSAAVRAYRVAYRVEPARSIIDGEPRTIGFDVVLCGFHDQPVRTPSPGCPACGSLWQVLAKIAVATLPPVKQSTFHIQPFRPLLHYDSHHSQQGSVELVVEIRHVSGYAAPLDGCESDCMHTIVTKLRELGVAASG